MTLIKTSLLNAIAVAIKMLTMLGINKILAVYVGPSGYAALGQFQNAVQMITTFGSGAINTGVTKYTAEYFHDEALQHKVWRTAGTIALVGSIFTGVFVVFLNKYLALLFLKDENYGSVFIWFGVTLVFFVLNALLMAILNGKKEVFHYVIINIIGSLFSLAISALMIVSFGLYGALLTLAINQSLTFFVTLSLCYRKKWFNFRYIIGRVDKFTAINLGKYTAMALVSAITVPLSHIMVRNHLAAEFGWTVAGYWDAMWRLSTAYLMFVTTTLGVYYLPRLSELKDSKAIKNEILQGYKIILPLAIIGGASIYILRDFIVSALFSKDFYPMRDLFAWQMLGDTLKIGSWILAYLMLGKALVSIFITTEIIFGFGFFAWTWIFTSYFGMKSAVVAHAMNYFIYWIVIYLIFLKNKII
ncbi:O-antigen translocase [Comamonas fluminis]|uniref:O-antigen translocase n=1 Tax=Comamonas fluminis TaxID=2796366 RepID=UPI001C465215|nr:O-antigen translocase [Comamonas fluminis]